MYKPQIEAAYINSFNFNLKLLTAVCKIDPKLQHVPLEKLSKVLAHVMFVSWKTSDIRRALFINSPYVLHSGVQAYKQILKHIDKHIYILETNKVDAWNEQRLWDLSYVLCACNEARQNPHPARLQMVADFAYSLGLEQLLINTGINILLLNTKSVDWLLPTEHDTKCLENSMRIGIVRLEGLSHFRLNCQAKKKPILNETWWLQLIEKKFDFLYAVNWLRASSKLLSESKDQ